VCKRNIEARSRNDFNVQQARSIAYSECVSVAIVIQNAMRMRRIMLSSVDCLAVTYVCTFSHKRHGFPGGGGGFNFFYIFFFLKIFFFFKKRGVVFFFSFFFF